MLPRQVRPAWGAIVTGPAAARVQKEKGAGEQRPRRKVTDERERAAKAAQPAASPCAQRRLARRGRRHGWEESEGVACGQDHDEERRHVLDDQRHRVSITWVLT